jgi:hypothetical protein
MAYQRKMIMMKKNLQTLSLLSLWALISPSVAQAALAIECNCRSVYSRCMATKVPYQRALKNGICESEYKACAMAGNKWCTGPSHPIYLGLKIHIGETRSTKVSYWKMCNDSCIAQASQLNVPPHSVACTDYSTQEKGVIYFACCAAPLPMPLGRQR